MSSFVPPGLLTFSAPEHTRLSASSISCSSIPLCFLLAALILAEQFGLVSDDCKEKCCNGPLIKLLLLTPSCYPCGTACGSCKAEKN